MWRSVSIFTIWCYLIANLTYLLLMVPPGLTQHNGNPLIVEPTPALNFQEKALTTVLLVSNEANESYRRFHSLRPEVGLLTSTARTFIQNGVTTEYATQVVGTTLDNGRLYAQYLKKSSRVLFESDSIPSVLTSWIGDSTTLPQSHNDLYNADRPEWQDQDDRLRKAFVGNTDFIGEIDENRIKIPSLFSYSVSPTISSKNVISSSQMPSFKTTHNINDMENNFKKLAAQKVLPIGDLPTFTVKNNFLPSGFSESDSNDNNKYRINKHLSKTDYESRVPKIYYQKFKSEIESDSYTPMRASDVPVLFEKRKLATTTYYGFADFTTVVGDSVIVFSPSSSFQQIQLGQVTSIKGEATLGDLSPPQVSYIPITVSEDFIMPTSVNENQILATVRNSTSNELLSSSTFPKTVKSEETKPLDLFDLKNSNSLLSEEKSKGSTISILSNSAKEISATLSIPSDEEISAIFSMLQKEDKSNNDNNDKSADITVPPSVMIKPSSTVPTQAGATTIFFEEDPFANFVDPSSSSGTEFVDNNFENVKEKSIDAEISQYTYSNSSSLDLSVLSISNSQHTLLPSVEESSVLQSIYSIVSSTAFIQVDKTPPLNSVTTLASGIVIKELFDTEMDRNENCLRTSQIFLTQLPKTVTYFTSYFTIPVPDNPSQNKSLSSIETNVVNTFDIVETTKNYCIQSTSLLKTESKELKTEKLSDNVNNDILSFSEGGTTESDLELEMQNTSEEDEDETTNSPDLEVDFDSGDGPSGDDEDYSAEEELELVFKTLYTTYTYLTTIFQESTSSILSRTEIITSVVSSTIGDLKSDASFVENFKSEITPTTTTTSVKSKLIDLNNLDNIIREEEENRQEKDNSNDALSISPTEQLENFQLNTFQTTYTYFTTIFAEGETEILSRTEVLTNIVSAKPSKLSESISTGVDSNANLYDTSSIEASTTGYTKALSVVNTPNYSTMIRNGTISSGLSRDSENVSSIMLVTDVRSSSSTGEGHIIDDNMRYNSNQSLHEQIIDDQISSESNTDEIVPSATLLLQTSFTTFTYYTTMYNNTDTNIISRLETITNVVTETISPSSPSGKQNSASEEATLPVTYFTTFTYWTKLARDGIISTLSREETITNIINPTTTTSIENGSIKSTDLMTSTINNTQDLSSNIDIASSSSEIASIENKILEQEPTTYYTTYTYYTTSYEADITITNSRFETITNVITPTSILPTSEVSPTSLIGVLPNSNMSDIYEDEQQKSLLPKKDILLFDIKKIIDADGISTLFFETEVSPSIDDNGVPVEITRSSSSLYIDELKRNIIPTSSISLTINSEGETVSVRQYKTGLVRLIEGTRIGNHTTTLYQSKVIGTLIENRYAQIIESTSSFLFEKASSSSVDINASKTENYILEATNVNTLNPGIDVLESSTDDSTITDEQNESDEKHSEDQDNEGNSEQSSFQSKKSKFTPVIRPFASRGRPQFAPKKKTAAISSATIITRSDFTPTITATPALKSNRFSTSKKNFGSSLNSDFGSSSRRFGRPGKPSVSINQVLSSNSIPNSSNFGFGGRNRFGVASRNTAVLGTSSRRVNSLSRSSLPGSAAFRPGFSSALNSNNNRFRIKPTAAFALGQSNNPTDLFTTPASDVEDPEEENFTQDSINDEEGEITTENSRRNQNPLLRFRRPLAKPNSSNQRGNSGNLNTLISTRRNPLTARAKTSTTTTTTTTTPKPRPRGFQRPTIGPLSARQRPQSSLFPPRGLFQPQKQDEVSESSTTENPDVDDDAEYEDEEGEESEVDNSDRKRRSSAKVPKRKAAITIEHKNKSNRSKREADVSYPIRSNFRGRFRKPKANTSISIEDHKGEEEENLENVTQQSNTHVKRINSRFGTKHRSSSTTAVTVNNRGIRPTRPNNGRSQFTLRERNTTSTTKSYQRNSSASLRRPQTSSTPSTRRAPTSISNKRRIKMYNNNNHIGTEVAQRNTNIGSRNRPSNLSSGRSRSSSSRGRNRNEFNMDLVSHSFDGTITVTHVIPSEVTIPVVSGQLTEYKNIITAKTSTEILKPQQYTSFIGTNGQTTLALTREESMTNVAGATEITQFIIHGSPTTMITFTPTTIRGRKTSFSHIIPSTAYSIEKLVSTMQPQLSNAPLANILLSQLLLGNIGLPGQAAGNPLIGQLSQPLITTQSPLSPVTDYRTHTSTYVTTIFEGMSTVLPVTFQALKTASKDIRRQIISGEDDSFHIYPTPISKLTRYGKSANYSQNNSYTAKGNLSPYSDVLEEARYNLATRIMSNGVEVIIAGEKSKSVDSSPNVSSSHYNEFHINPNQIQKPMTLAPSTLKNQMILLVPSSLKDNLMIPITRNQFVTKTCLTTYTYRTTYLHDGIATVKSQEKVIANIATEERNYPKITSTLSMGVTLTRTPQLAVGVFPTTYFYYYTLNDGKNAKVMTSDYTILNTITAPEDFIMFLQPSESATPVYDTNTYYNKIFESKTLDEGGVIKVMTRSETLTQVVVTESLPARSTSVLTSYYAFDIDETLISTFSTKFLPSSEKSTIDIEIKNRTTDIDMQIYATKTFFETFTYLTTNTLFQSITNPIKHLQSQSQSESQSQTQSDYQLLYSEIENSLPPHSFTTAINYHTKIIENVITETIPTSLLKPELVTKFRKELKKGKNQRSVIITMATLLGGQTLEITAMKMMNLQTSASSQKLNSATSHQHSSSPNTKKQNVPNIKASISHLNNVLNTKAEYLVEPLPPPKQDISSAIYFDEDSIVEGSELSPTVIEARPEKDTKNITVSQLSENINNKLGSWNLNSLTVLRPVLSAMADLLQSKFSLNTNLVNNKNPLKNLTLRPKQEKLKIYENPIYIPVKNSLQYLNNIYNVSNKAEKNQFQKESDINFEQLAPPQSLHIQPPLADFTLTDDSWMHEKYIIENNIRKNPYSYQQPLINGGIPIRPGEVITANSDVIVGKPNGIQQPKVYTLQSNIIPVIRDKMNDNDKLPSAFAITPKNIVHYEKNKQSTYTPYKHITAMSIENYDNILRPPPPPPPSAQLKYVNPLRQHPRPLINTINLSPLPPGREPLIEPSIIQLRNEVSLQNKGVNHKYYPTLSHNNDLRKNEEVSISKPKTINKNTQTAVNLLPISNNQFRVRFSSVNPNSSSKTLFEESTSKKLIKQNETQTYRPFAQNIRLHSNHQRVNLQNNVLNHNIAMNVPPLTFKKESELATSVLHGVPSNSDQIFMPHVKIPLNEVEVQVNLTPHHIIYPYSNFYDVNSLASTEKSKFPIYGAFTIESNEIPANNSKQPKPEYSNKIQVYHDYPSADNNDNNNNNKPKINSQTKDMTQEVHPVISFKANDVIVSNQTIYPPTRWNMNLSSNNKKPNLLSTSETSNQVGVFPSSKIEHPLPKNHSSPKNSTKYSFPSQNMESKRTTLPLLSPSMVLQVKQLVQGQASSNFSELQSIGKKNLSNLSTLMKISNKTNQSDIKLNKSKPKFSTINPLRIQLTSSTLMPLSSKHDGMENDQWKIKNNVKLEERERQSNSVFLHGQPFKPPNIIMQALPSQVHKTHLHSNLFIAAGEPFTPNHHSIKSSYSYPNIDYSNEKNISTLNSTQVKSKEKNKTSILTTKIDDISPLPVMSRKVNATNTSSKNTPQLKYNNFKQIAFTTTKQAEIYEQTIPPPKNVFSLETSNQYFSKSPPMTSKKTLKVISQSMQSNHQSVSDVLGLYPPPPEFSTYRPPTKNQYSIIKNTLNSISIKSETAAIPQLLKTTEKYSELAFTDSSASWSTLSNDYETNLKFSTSVQNRKNHEKSTQSAATSSGISFANNIILEPNIIIKPTSTFYSSINLISSKTNVEKLKENNNTLSDTLSKDSLQIILEPSLDFSTFATLTLLNENSSFHLKDLSLHSPIWPTSHHIPHSLTPLDSRNITMPLEQHMVLKTTVANTNAIVNTTTSISNTITTNAQTQEKTQGTTFQTTKLIHVTSTISTFVIDTVTKTQNHTWIEPTTRIEQEYKQKIIGFASPNDFVVTDFKTAVSTETNIVTNAVKEYNFSKETKDMKDSHIESDIENQMPYEKSKLNENTFSADNDVDNIFVVMTKSQGGPNTNINTPNDSFDQEYNENLSLDLATRDENIFIDSDSDSNEIANNILLGGVLIASTKSTIFGSEKSHNEATVKCQPNCKTSKNELCMKFGTHYQCSCRPGFARMFPDRPCKPTYTYTMRITIRRLNNILLEYNESLGNNSTKEFRELAAITHDAIDRMVMQSDFRDIYHGVSVHDFNMDEKSRAITANILLQFSDMNDEKRLEDVFRKYLRVNGYNIGMTELFTDKKGAEILTIEDFNECNQTNFHDCSNNARCFNLKGTYTCSCIEGYVDLSENSAFPGRLCSTDVMGCKKCNFHGQCVMISKKGLKENIEVCECFSWYSGSVCQLNLKILLIALMSIGTILFVVILICIFLMCIKQRYDPGKPTLGQVFSDTQNATCKMSKGNKKTSFIKDFKSDRHMIMETSSESSDSSLPYLLKESIRSEENDRSRVLTESLNEISQRNQLKVNKPYYYTNEELNPTLPTFTNFNQSVVTEIEQTDRSLTVMIPRAKYHPSVLPQTKLLYHQLTLERTNTLSPQQKIEIKRKSEEAEAEAETEAEAEAEIGKALRGEISTPGALVSAGFEVSAVVNDNVLQLNNESLTTLDSSSSCRTSDKPIQIQNSHKLSQYDIVKVNKLNLNKENGCHILNFKLNNNNKNSRDVMDEWFDNTQQSQSSAGKSFDNLMIQLTECCKSDNNNQTAYTNEEANTMAERDIGSTLLLPHTHLYKPERESDVSGLESM